MDNDFYRDTPDWRELDGPGDPYPDPDPTAALLRATAWVVALGLLAGLIVFLMV